MKRRMLAAGSMMICLAFGQPMPSFEVASIKPAPNCQIGAGRSGIMPGKLELLCVQLRALIRMAYGDVLAGGNLAPRLMKVVGGPGWLDSEHYDVSAKADRATREQVTGPMLRTLLEERCKLRVHREARDTDVYLLTVSKSGPELQPAKEGDCIPIDLSDLTPGPRGRSDALPKYCGGGRGHGGDGGSLILDWYGTSMPEAAGRMIAAYVDRPVVDQTGLRGRYNMHLEFVPEPPSGPITLNGVPGMPPPSSEAGGPSIFTALEKQLGLKLIPGKGPVEVIVVDSVEKPSAN